MSMNLIPGQSDWGDLAAALTYTTEPGGMRVDDLFQREILDIQRRRGVFGQRLTNLPATGQPSRYIQQTALPGNQEFVSPTNLVPAATGTPNREEKALYLKALVGQMDNSLFNTEVTNQQGVFTPLQAKDFNDGIDALLKKHDKALWQGTSTGPTDSAGLEYSGFFKQLTAASNPFTVNVSAGVSIVEKFNLVVAQIMSQESVDVVPTAAYCHPMAIEALQREVSGKASFFNQVEIRPGYRVNAIATMAGDIPLIADPLIGKTDINGDGTTDSYPIAIVTESMLEFHYLTDPNVRIFELGLAAGLARRRVMVKFGGFLVKAPNLAHGLLRVADNWTPPV